MKKLALITLCMGLLTITACDNKKETATTVQTAETEAITDSAYQQKAAGDYTSPDKQTVISLGNDFTVTVKNYSKKYYKWEFVSQPEANTVNIMLIRKGMDSDIKEEALLDTQEGKIIVNNETLRKQ